MIHLILLFLCIIFNVQSLYNKGCLPNLLFVLVSQAQATRMLPPSSLE